VSSVTDFGFMLNNTMAFSDENKCAVHTSFSSNGNWTYSWASFCN